MWSAPGGKAWGTYANGSGTPTMAAFRGFGWYGGSWAHALADTGDVFRVSMEHGSLASYGAVGFVLRHGNSDFSSSDYNAGARFEFGYWGADANYSIYDGNGSRIDTGVTARNTGLRLELVLTEADSYSFRIYDAAGGQLLETIAGELASTGSIDSVALYNRNSDTLDDDTFFNQMEIVKYKPEALILIVR